VQVTTIGLDIAKNVLQVHANDTAEKVVVRKQLRRSQVLAFFGSCCTQHRAGVSMLKLRAV
jgi:transposase